MRGRWWWRRRVQHTGTTSECGSGDICSNIQGDGNQCRPLCTTQAECPVGENCEGIANTNLKSCQPVPATAVVK
jgi:hypothetical protein